MDNEEIIKIIRDEVSKEFGAEKIKGIRYFGPHEDEDLDVSVYVEGIDGYKDGLEVNMQLFDMFYEMDLDVPISIERAKVGGGMTRLLVVAAVAGASAAWEVYPGEGTPIQMAIDGAEARDTIYVHAGMYVANVYVDKLITLIGDGADVVTGATV